MLQLLLHAEKIHVSVVNFRFHVMPCSMVWSGEAAEVQRLVDALALGGVDRKEFLTLHHRAVFTALLPAQRQFKHFRGCVCTHAFLLRLVASDRSMSCQKFCNPKVEASSSPTRPTDSTSCLHAQYCLLSVKESCCSTAAKVCGRRVNQIYNLIASRLHKPARVVSNDMQVRLGCPQTLF